MKKNSKRVTDFRASSCTVGSDVLPLIDVLSREGWCVCLKKTPPDVGYNEIGTGERKFPGHWYCEVSYIRPDKTVAPPVGLTSEDPLLLIREMAKRCRQNVAPQPERIVEVHYEYSQTDDDHGDHLH